MREKIRNWKTDEDPKEDMLNKGLMIGCLMAVAIFIVMEKLGGAI